MKIAIATPNGKIGSQVVQMLLDDGSHELVLLAHHASKATDATARGAIVFEGDLGNRDYVIEATRRVDALLWIIPPDPTATDTNKMYRDLAHNAVEAVKANDIGQVVFISCIGGHLGQGLGIVDVYRDTEKILRDGVDNLRILRPTYFMENLLASLESIRSDQRLYLPVNGDINVPLIATKDIATVAAALLKQPFNGTQVIELLGPRDYSFDQAAKILGDAIGETVTFTPVPPELALGALTSRGMSEHMAQQVVGLMQGIDRGRLRSEHPRSKESTTPTTLEEFAREIFAPAVAAKV